MDIEQSIKDFTAMIETINEKYEKIIIQIQDQVDKINKMGDIYKDQSDEFIQKEIMKAKRRMEKYKEEAHKMLQEQTDNANKWLDNIKKEIQEQITRAIKKIAEALI